MSKVLLAHGSGGKLSHDLVKDIFAAHFSNPVLDKMDDAALVEVSSKNIVMTTDSFVVKPLFFNGGDIGRLAVCGTVNDIAMKGAKPLYLTVGFILEEGVEIDMLQQVVKSMRDAADEAGVQIVAGDTKVVEKGAADQIYINTSGVGVLDVENPPSGDRAEPGDVVLVNGFIGDHGMAVMAAREGLDVPDEVASDAAPLNELVAEMLKVCPEMKVLRDPTRGGLATTLNEIAGQSEVRIELDEEEIPVRNGVQAACEIFGFDPLYLANEGKLIAILPEEKASQVLEIMRENKYGQNAKIIGQVVSEHSGQVVLKTSIGGKRIVDMLVGEQLPRIC